MTRMVDHFIFGLRNDLTIIPFPLHVHETNKKRLQSLSFILSEDHKRSIFDLLCFEASEPTLVAVQYVTQYADGTSIRTLETKTQFLRRPFQFSVNEVFRMKVEHFSFKMKVLKVLAICKLAKQSRKTPFCSGE